MKIKPLASFSQSDLVIVVTAMSNFRKTLSKPAMDLFDVDFIKVVRHGRNVEMDGCGMKQISYALKLISEEMFEVKGSDSEERKLLVNMAFEIDMARICFQKQYGPSVDKKIG